MKIAINKDGQIVYAVKHAQSPLIEPLYCPKCKGEVFVRTNHKGTSYFVHRYSCGSSNFGMKRQTQESSEHKFVKQYMIEVLQHCGYQVMLEHFVKQTGQYIDVFVEKSNLAIEFQKSQISPKILKQRHEAYLNLGVKCMWIFDRNATRFHQNWSRITRQFHKNLGFYWVLFDTTHLQLYLRFIETPLCPMDGYTYKEIVIPKNRWLDLFLALLTQRAIHIHPNHCNCMVSRNHKVIDFRRWQQSIMRNPVNHPYLHYLYEQRIVFSHYTQQDLFPLMTSCHIQTPSWCWKVLILNALNSTSHNEVETAIANTLSLPIIKYYPAPLIQHECYSWIQASLKHQLTQITRN